LFASRNPKERDISVLVVRIVPRRGRLVNMLMFLVFDRAQPYGTNCGFALWYSGREPSRPAAG
jgi:hypothetical protein